MRIIVVAVLVGCVHSKPIVVDPDDGARVVEDMEGTDDPLAIEAARLEIAVVDRADGFRRQRAAFVRAPDDTVDQAIIRFLVRARDHRADAVTALVVHETDRDAQCVTRISASEIPQPEGYSVPGRLMARDKLVASLHHAVFDLRYRPYVEIRRETELARERPQVVARLGAPTHPDRQCTPTTELDRRGGLWVSGTLLYR